MKIFCRFAIISFYTLFLTNSCSIIGNRKVDFSGIIVKWELISPNIAAFTIRNNSSDVLNGENWNLYFNMAPRPLISIDSTKNILLEHINGDYYRIIPLPGFNLKSGDSISITYQFSWMLIKETDAPRGLYFVATNKKGKELGIYPVKDYWKNPLEAVLESKIDPQNEFNSYLPQFQYLQNLQIKTMPENEWQPLIPQPVKILVKDQLLTIDSTFIISYDSILTNEANYIHEILESEFGIEIRTDHTDNDSGKIKLRLKSMVADSKDKEAYQLDISKDGILITGSDPAGVFYGIQSLLAMVPIQYFGKDNNLISLKCASVEDAPRFEYRGLHLDVCRHFQPKSEILKVLDLMAFYKLNKLHLYLTEDEGWRIEIKALPELTEIGSRRGHCPNEDRMLNPAYGSGPYPDSNQYFGSGYYKREDFIEILKYAKERHIQVIPSMNFPGHARAAIKSMEVRYHRLMKEGKEEEAKKFRLIQPVDHSEFLSAQFYTDNIVDISLESVYRFYDTVLSSIAAMYKDADVPLAFINTGGDEVPPGAWANIAGCEKLMQELGISDSKDLQSYFTGRLLKTIKKYNLEAGGWEEIALKEGKEGSKEVNPEFVDGRVVPYVWNNLAGAEDLGYKLANAGYPIVLCCVTNFYLDMAYNADPNEPGLYWGGFTDEYDPWIAAPYNLTGNNSQLVKLNKEARMNILGLQAQLWAETIVGPEMLEYYLLPKLLSFAERAWAEEPDWEEMHESKLKESLINYQWNSFINAVSQRELPRLNTLFGGFNYRVPPPGVIIEDGKLKVNCQYPGVKIYYTTDGAEPYENSIPYNGPFEITKNEIKIITIDQSGRKSRILKISK